MADVIKINLTFPESWSDLSDKQLLFLYKLLAQERSPVEIKTRCLLRWNSVSVIGRKPDGKYIMKRGKLLFDISALEMAGAVSSLGLIDETIPSVPVRPSRLCGRTPLPADFQEVPLKTFIMIDNLYQGWLISHSPDLMYMMFQLLYPKRGLRSPFYRFKPAVVETAVFYWFASVKAYFSRRWPEFFKPASPQAGANMLGNSGTNLETNMNAMIRALTKGDITKEHEVLKMDSWRALEELNAQAREYNEFNSKYGNK